MNGSASSISRVVVVEDDPVLLNLLCELLTSLGYRVFPHNRAHDAYLLVRNVRPDVVLLDLRLGEEPYGGASGWQVLDQIVLDPRTRGIPVVLASGAIDSIEAHRPALLPQHRVRILLKPYDLDQLVAALTEAVEPPRARARPDLGTPSIERLTPRQREIARLVALGCTNSEIGLRLVVEPGTVANHVAHILDRLGVANRAQVAAWAAHHGLMDSSERQAALGRGVA